MSLLSRADDVKDHKLINKFDKRLLSFLTNSRSSRANSSRFPLAHSRGSFEKVRMTLMSFNFSIKLKINAQVDRKGQRAERGQV